MWTQEHVALQLLVPGLGHYFWFLSRSGSDVPRQFVRLLSQLSLHGPKANEEILVIAFDVYSDHTFRSGK